MPKNLAPFTPSRLRQRPAFLATIALFSLLSLLALWQPDSIPSATTLKSFSPSNYFYKSSTHSTTEETLEILSQLYEDERISLLRAYDQASTEMMVKTPTGALSPDFNGYITRLETFVDNYFNGSVYHPNLVDTLSRMVNAKPPLMQSKFTKRVISFDKDGRGGVPDEFEWWDRRLKPLGWDIQVGNDDQMERWYNDCSGALKVGLSDHEILSSGKKRWEDLWHGLGRPVLKSDLLRYLMMLVQGGLYTDSDTSILSDPDLWGIHANDITPRGLVALQRAMRHLDPSTLSTIESASHMYPPPSIYEKEDEQEIEEILQLEQPSETSLSGWKREFDIPATEIEDVREENIPISMENEDQQDEESDAISMEDLDFASKPIQDSLKGINNPHISLVVAVEYDLHHPRQDPRTAYTRDLQIVQWTFMAKPFHPIFMDVLETATTLIMHQRESGQSQDSWKSVLDGTGPGPFTDAVLRYLLNQYGVTPHELVGMEQGALIGDVLILPLHAFGNWLGGENDWNAEDPSTRCTAHGFRGRWKGDMNFAKRSRVQSEPLIK